MRVLANVFLVDTAVASNQERGGKTQYAAELFGDFVVPGQHGVFDFEPQSFDIGLDIVSPAGLHRDSQHGEAAPRVALLQLIPEWDLLEARLAPKQKKINKKE